MLASIARARGRQIRRPLLTCAALLLLSQVMATTAAGQEAQGELSEQLGFVDFSDFGLFSEDNLDVEVSVQRPMLRLVAAAARGEDPDLADMLERLMGVEVQVYDTPADLQGDLKKAVRQVARRLRSDGWTSAVTLRNDQDFGQIFLRLDGERPMGLAAIYLDHTGQAYWVNIVGEIDPAQIGRLARRFDLDFLSQTQLPSTSPSTSNQDDSEEEAAQDQPPPD